MYDSIKMGEYLAAYAAWNGYSINQTKLQKLLYILYGAYLTACNECLLSENPKAWPSGPVFPRVQRKFAKVNDLSYADTNNSKFEEIRRDERLLSLIEAVFRTFGSWSARELSEWSRKPGSPWALALANNNMSFDAVITPKSIGEYFKTIRLSEGMDTAWFEMNVPDTTTACSDGDFNPDEDDLNRQKTKRYGQDTRHRSRLVKWVMWIIPFWLVSVLLIVAFASAEKVSDTVKTTLLVTTTANVIGLALVVLKGLFNDRETEN